MATIEEKIQTVVERLDLQITAYTVMGVYGFGVLPVWPTYITGVDWWIAFHPITFDDWAPDDLRNKDHDKEEYSLYYFQKEGQRYCIPWTVWWAGADQIANVYEDRNDKAFLERLDQAYAAALEQ